MRFLADKADASLMWAVPKRYTCTLSSSSPTNTRLSVPSISYTNDCKQEREREKASLGGMVEQPNVLLLWLGNLFGLLQSYGWHLVAAIVIGYNVYAFLKPYITAYIDDWTKLPDVKTDEDKVIEARKKQYQRHMQLTEEKKKEQEEEKRRKILEGPQRKTKASIRRELLDSYPDYDFSNGQDFRRRFRPARICSPRGG
eukprot:m.12858 g.12858  ORF g.12858 m.12858 type:complete len:199 (-) comp4072_c0_seq1:457-1053(-)